MTRLILLLILGGTLGAQTPDVEFGPVEDRIRIVARRAVEATVFIWNGAGGSGVIVSEDGLVLTAAHVLKRPKGRLQVQLHNGRTTGARILGRLPEHDAAVIKLTGKGPWPFCPMAPAGSLPRGSLCLSTGVPLGIRSDRPAPLRLGTVLDRADDFLRSSCTLDQGDSGGPLFDLQGRVVGVHSRIGRLLTMNYHIAIELFHAKWEQLSSGKVSKDEVESDPRFHRSALRNAGQPWRLRDDVQKRAAELVRPALRSVVEVEREGKRRALGIVVDAGGWILSKASACEGATRCRLRGGKLVPIVDRRKDHGHDLVLLKVDAQDLVPLDFASDVECEQGRLLFTPNPRAPTRLGLISVPPRAIARVRTRLGVILGTSSGGGALIKKITTGSSADRGGLKVDDVIIEWDGKAIEKLEDLRRELGKIDPGTRVKLRIRRAGKERALRLLVGSTREIIAHRKGVPPRPEALRGLRLSRRRSGFPLAFEHDTVLDPKDCGGPILDRAGRCIGINAARASRHSSYAIPAPELMRVVRKLRGQGR